MTYYEELRRRIANLTGLTGIEVDHILRALEKAGVDPEAIDWETLGHEIADKSNRYEAAWDWLAAHYGISKPVEIGLERTIEKYREMQEEYEREYEEMEKYLTEEGIREALRKLYSPETPEEEKEEIREAILYRSKDYEWIPLGLVSKIAIRDGEEQEYAKRFLSEYVKPPEEKKITEEDVLNVLSEEKGKTIIEIADELKVSTDKILPILEALVEEDKVIYDPVKRAYRKKPYVVPTEEEEEIERRLLELLEKRRRKLEAEKAIIYYRIEEEFPQFYVEKLEFVDDKIRVRLKVKPDWWDFYIKKILYAEAKDIDSLIRAIRRLDREYYKLAGKEEYEIRKKIRRTLMKGIEVKGEEEMKEIVEEEKARVETWEEMCEACLRWGTQTRIECPSCAGSARMKPEETMVIGHLKEWGEVYCCPVCKRLFTKDLHLLWYPPPSR